MMSNAYILIVIHYIILEEFFTKMFGISHGRMQKVLLEDTLDILMALIDTELNSE